MKSHQPEPSLLALLPPYAEYFGVSERGLAPGGIVLLDERLSPAEVATALTAAERAPWCAPCAVRSNGRLRSANGVTVHLGTPARLAAVAWPHGAPPPERVVEAVLRRHPPTPEEMAGWVVRRVQNPRVEQALAWTFRWALGGDGVHTSLLENYRELVAALRPLGRFRVKDWVHVVRLACIAATVAPSERSNARLASELHVDPRTVARVLRRLLRLPLDRFAERVGWEWVLETGVRRSLAKT